MMKKTCLLLLVLLLITGCDSREKEKVVVDNKITTEEVYKLIDDMETVIVDVRESYEYNYSHIKNAINVPLSDIESFDNLGFNKDKKIIVYCQSGRRSEMALKELNTLGYTNVFDMSGINSWDYELVSE